MALMDRDDQRKLLEMMLSRHVRGSARSLAQRLDAELTREDLTLAKLPRSPFRALDADQKPRPRLASPDKPQSHWPGGIG